MPIYEYECTDEKCKHLWEEEQKITSDASTKCPHCEKETAKRLIGGGTTFIKKSGGCGW